MMPARRSIAVVGLGNIGAAVAASIAAAGRHDLVACVRTAIDHLVLERSEGEVCVALRSTTDPREVDPVDWVLLCTKFHQTPSTQPWLASLLGPQTRVAVLQNGIGQTAAVREVAPGARVVPAIVYYNGERVPPDRVRMRHVGPEDLAVQDDADGRDFAELLAGTFLSVGLVDDFVTRAWRKLLLNIVANPITALTLQRQAVLRHPDVHRLGLALVEEAAHVGRAEGARLDADIADQTLATLLTYPPGVGTSMYFDRLASRPLEAEALTGSVVRAGIRHGLPTPINSALLALLRAISDAAEN